MESTLGTRLSAGSTAAKGVWESGVGWEALGTKRSSGAQGSPREGGNLGRGQTRGAVPHPVPQATSRTERQRCCRSNARSQLRYSAVRPRVSPMYSCHTRAARPSAYWSGSPSAATPKDRVRYTLSTIAPTRPRPRSGPASSSPHSPRLSPPPAGPPIRAPTGPPATPQRRPRPLAPQRNQAGGAAPAPPPAPRRAETLRHFPRQQRRQELRLPRHREGRRAGCGGGSGEKVFIYSPGRAQAARAGRVAGPGTAAAASRSWSPSREAEGPGRHLPVPALLAESCPG